MKILIVGSWVSAVYEQPLYQAFKDLNHDVHSFKWSHFFQFTPGSNKYDVENGFLKSIWFRFQNKYIFGPAISRLNKELILQAKENKYELIFLYRATHVWESTVKKLKETGAKIMIYNNDDPFTSHLPKYIYRHYNKALKHADWIFAYREKNIQDYHLLGYKNCSLLMSSYISKNNFHIPKAEKVYDVIFIGHFEEDGRDKVIYELMNIPELKIGLWGQNWQSSEYYEKFKAYMHQDIQPLFGKDYNLTINKAKIALVFFSKINNDGYTRRCFEIPATKTLMLCEYSDKMEKMFTSNYEAIYFKDKSEINHKIEKLLNSSRNSEKISYIANNGYLRLMKDRHEITDRANEIINTYFRL